MKKLCVVLMILVAIPLTALAQAPPPVPHKAPAAPPPPPPPGGAGKWWKNSATVRDLGLSEAQVAQLENEYLQHQPQLAALRSVLLAEEEKLKALLAADWLDEKALLAQTQAVNAERAALQSENTEMTLGMRRVMTGEQWARLEKIRQEKAVSPPPPPPPAPSELPPLNRIVFDMATPGIQEPRITSHLIAPYTAEAKEAQVEGVVVMQAVFRYDGTITAVKVLHGIGYGMDEAAAKSLSTWKFVPAQLNGQPVSVKANVEMSFRLAKRKS